MGLKLSQQKTYKQITNKRKSYFQFSMSEKVFDMATYEL